MRQEAPAADPQISVVQNSDFSTYMGYTRTASPCQDNTGMHTIRDGIDPTERYTNEPVECTKPFT